MTSLNIRACGLISIIFLFVARATHAQMTLTGRLLWPPLEGSPKEVGIGHVLIFGSLPGADKPPLAFRSRETNPVGWYRLSGPAGRYTLLFAQPGNFMRPAILNNIYTRDGEKINLSRSVRTPWDEARASFNRSGIRLPRAENICRRIAPRLARRIRGKGLRR